MKFGRHESGLSTRRFKNSFIDETLRKKIGHHYSLDTNVLLLALGLNPEYEYNKLTINATTRECCEWLKHARVSIYQPILRMTGFVLENLPKSYNEKLEKVKKSQKRIQASLDQLTALRLKGQISEKMYTKRENKLKGRSRRLEKKREELQRLRAISTKDGRAKLEGILNRPNIRLLSINENLMDYLKKLNSSLLSRLLQEWYIRDVNTMNDLALLCLSDYEDATIVTFDYPLMRIASKYKINCHSPWKELPYKFTGSWEK